MFSGSFTTALRPPIVKSYAENNENYVNKLFGFGNKFIYYAMLMACIPLFFEMETVLSVWLNEYDVNTVLFSRLIIIYTILMVLHDPITTIVQASGQIKKYYLLTESFTILCMPITYMVYKFGAPAYATFVVMCVAIACSHIMRLYVLKKQYHLFDVYAYVMRFVIPALIITALIICLVLLIDCILLRSLFRLLLTIFVSIVSISGLVYTIALNKAERLMIADFFHSFIIKTKSRQ